MSTKIELFSAYQRHFFDPTAKADMKLAKDFFIKHAWGSNGCPFFLEVPWLNVPDMLKDRIMKYHLDIKI
jgi:hypothetical protein